MIALLYLDLDGFKLVNDSLGHAVGDGLLVQYPAASGRRVARWGYASSRWAEMNSLVMHGLQARKQAVQCCARFAGAISNPFEVKGHELAIGASIGISVFPEDGTDPEELIQQGRQRHVRRQTRGQESCRGIYPRDRFLR
jgi:diguanylate cyclase (GGDEF)-like protein